MKKLKIVIFGCRENTIEFIETIDKKKFLIKKVITITKNCAIRNKVSGYKNFKNLSIANKLIVSPKYNLSHIKIQKFFSKNKFDLGISIGWQRIIPESILSKFKHSVIGMHCSYLKLPNGKGRSPINWTLIKGYNYLFAQIFSYTAKFDEGPVLYNEKMKINSSENISEIQKKLALFFSSYLNTKSNFLRKPIKKQSNFNGAKIEFKKRDKNSGLIVLKNHNSKTLCDFVRAQSYPYPGAFFLVKKTEFIIDEIKIFHTDGKLKLINKKFHIFNDKTILFKLKKDYILITKHRINSKYLKNEYLNKIFL